ncbi:Uncharacterized protein FWK35_00035501, partial [Aphis craccivora]
NIIDSSNIMDSSDIIDSSGNIVNLRTINAETPIVISDELSTETDFIKSKPAIIIDITKTPVNESCIKPVQPGLCTKLIYKKETILKTSQANPQKMMVGIMKECELRVKRQKITIETEEKMNKLQVCSILAD